MQKIGLLCFLIGMSSISLFSQSENLRLGFQISPTISSLKSSDAGIQTKGANLGLILGAMGEYYLSDKIAITGGLNLSFHQGGKIIHEIGGNFFTNSELSDDVLNTGDMPLPNGVKLNYSLQTLEIPFGMKIRTRELGYFRIFAELPTLNFIFVTQARANIEGAGVNVEKENIKKDVSFANFYLGAGIGGEYAISESTSFVFGIYYNGSVIDVTDNDAYKAFPNPNDRPGDPTDDYFRQEEDSKGSISRFTIKLGLLF
jgi:hypothetical protein